jgi:hypothetical protein
MRWSGGTEHRHIDHWHIDHSHIHQCGIDHFYTDHWRRNEHHCRINHVYDLGRIRGGPGGGQSLRVDGVVVGGVGGARDPR